MLTDVLGAAIADYYYKNAPAKLWVYDTIGPRVEMKVEIKVVTRKVVEEEKLMVVPISILTQILTKLKLLVSKLKLPMKKPNLNPLRN